MLFLLDQMVDAAVGVMLRDERHQAVTASEIGHAGTDDADLAVVADDMNAVLVSHDRRFSYDRQTGVQWGRHVYLNCRAWDAADVLREALPEIAYVLEHKDAVFVELRPHDTHIRRGSFSRGDRLAGRPELA